MKLYVHRNLHRRIWSVTYGSNPPTRHYHELFLEDVEMRVRPGGRARARREGTKNVHAYLVVPGLDSITLGRGPHAGPKPRGTVAARLAEKIEERGLPKRITYTPFRRLPHFILVGTLIEWPVARADAVWCDAAGHCWVWGAEPPDEEAT